MTTHRVAFIFPLLLCCSRPRLPPADDPPDAASSMTAPNPATAPQSTPWPGAAGASTFGALERLALTNIHSMLGNFTPPKLRRRLAQHLAAVVRGLVRSRIYEPRVLSRLASGLFEAARDMPSIARIPMPTEEAALLKRFGLGGPERLLPKALAGVRFGMSVGELVRARPRSEQLRRRRSRLLEVFPPGSTVKRAEYSFRSGGLHEVRMQLGFSRLWPELVAKLRATWGAPRYTRRRRYRWRMSTARAQVIQHGSRRPIGVSLRVRRRIPYRSQPSSWLRFTPKTRSTVVRSRSLRSIIRRNIRRLRQGYYQISPYLLREARRQPRKYFGRIRMTPWIERGDPVGIRVFSIRFDSAAYRLGLRNGDALVRLNGKPIRDPVELTKNLKRGNRFVLEIRRRGRSRQIVYTVGG